MNKIRLKKVNISLFFLFSLIIPLNQKISTVFIFVLLFTSLLTFDKAKVKFTKEILVLPLLFVLYILSMLAHPPFNIDIVAMKVSFIIFPLLFILNNFTKLELLKMYKFFIYGCVLAIIFCYANAFYQSVNYQEGALVFNSYIIPNASMLNGGNHFFGKAFSIFHQSVYFSMYVNIALIGVLNLNLFSKKLTIALVLLFALVIFQISNKANIGILFILLLVTLLYQIKKVKLKWASTIVLLIVGISLVLIHPRTRAVIKNAYANGVHLDREAEGSTGVRLLVWDAALTLSKANFLTGVGVANGYEALKKVYKQKRYVIPYRNRLNAHNQFLQMSIECGVLGLIFLFLQLKTLLKAKNGYKLLYTSFFLVMLFNFFFEAVFNRYSGMMSYSFFFCLLVMLNTKKTTFLEPVN